MRIYAYITSHANRQPFFVSQRQGERVGRIRKGLLADLVAVHGDPSEAIKDIRNVVLVIKDGKIYLERQAGPDR